MPYISGAQYGFTHMQTAVQVM